MKDYGAELLLIIIMVYHTRFTLGGSCELYAQCVVWDLCDSIFGCPVADHGTGSREQQRLGKQCRTARAGILLYCNLMVCW